MLTATPSNQPVRPPVHLLRPADRPSSEWLPGARAVTHLLDVVDYGVVMTTGEGRLLFSNRAADEWLATEQPLCIRHGVMTTGATDRAPAFAEALRNAARRGIQTLLSFDQAVGDRGCVSVVPLADTADAPLVLLMLSRRHDSQTLSQEAYARRLDLTSAQTRVLKLLCAGVKPPDIARRLAVKLTTVRSHISAIREKTGVHDTASIVHQVARLPPLPCVLRWPHQFG